MTEPRREPLAAALEVSAEELYEDAPCGYLTTLPDGWIVRANRTLLAWTGFTRQELAGRRFSDLLTPGGRIYHETHYAPLLVMQDSVGGVAFEIRRADRSRLPILVNSIVKRDADGAPLLIHTTIFDATDRQGYERELVLARDRERRAREQTERLQRLTAALAASLLPDEVAETLLTELGAAMATADAEVVLLDPDRGATRTVRRGVAGAPEWRLGSVDTQPSEVAQALRTGAAWFAPDGASGVQAALPLTQGRRRLGALVLGPGDATELDEADRGLLVAVTAQCALALDRAMLLAQEAEVAQVLQRSLLETVPLRDGRVRVGARYRPAIDALQVGGDWYDAFPIDAARIGVVVGDVVGRGIEAASAMGQLRSATRALAVADLGGPARVISHLDRFAERVPLAFMATLVYVEIDVERATVRYACAGHPPPLLATPGSGVPVPLWGGRSVPLGAGAHIAPPRDGQVDVGPGARLLLYSDGLVERRREVLDVGLDRLASAMHRGRDSDPQTLVDRVVDEVVTDVASRDDVCVVCVEIA